ncbi:hypothetical protein [Sandarakinorhabdus sp. DWP1-3-1]|uniref:hypothetical protein n=1 Tax=Sandarakinorhabdus sp. DWP1-3-1 TaxID=2804627 RepID=UPI003CEA8E72
MKTSAIVFTTLLAIGTAVAAQEASSNPALKDPAPAAVTALAEGANSFTADQARGRMAKAGYPGVTDLVKTKDGQWVGSAMKGSQQVRVTLDYKGDVVAQ